MKNVSLESDIYFANPGGMYRHVSEDVGIVQITVASTASTDIEAFLYFYDHCKSIMPILSSSLTAMKLCICRQLQILW